MDLYADELRVRHQWTHGCPVCGAGQDRSHLFLDNTYDPKRVTEFSFASRKEPEFMSFRLQRCGNCDVVYAGESLGAEDIHRSYHQASYDSSDEALMAARSYIRALHPILCSLQRGGTALEIGTGTGIFLEQLIPYGFSHLTGVEPSRAAIDSASNAIRPSIREGIFKESDYPTGSFSFICCFMTLEHVINPLEIVASCQRLLAPGGKVAFVTHDYMAWNNRLLGRKSPIIDIEHLQLFNRVSIAALMRNAGLKDISVRSFVNTYNLSYWIRLFPFPRPIKSFLQWILRISGAGRIRFGMNVGNLITTASSVN